MVGSTTVFVQLNYARGLAKGHPIMTIAFGIGQTLGPTLIGAMTTRSEACRYALIYRRAVLALGAMLTAVPEAAGSDGQREVGWLLRVSFR